MAATITFRPRAGIREALDARCANGGPDRTAVINAALARYLDVTIEESGSLEAPQKPIKASSGTPKGPPRAQVEASKPQKARQAVPSPAGEVPECPHPKAALKKLPYGTQCTECGRMLKR